MGPWARGRARELADQLLDYADSFRQRWTECGHGLRCAGWAIAESVRDLPWVCGRRREAFALASRRAGSASVEAALDLAWVVTQGVGWMRSRRRRIVALAAAPLVPALAVLVLFSSQTVGGTALAAAPASPRDAHPISAVDPVQGNVASRRHVVVRQETASRPARVASSLRQTARPMRVGLAAKAVQRRSGKARTALRPKAVARVAAQRPRRSPSPHGGVPAATAPAGPAREAPAAKPEPVSTAVALPETAQAQSQPEQQPDRRQPSEIQPPAPSVTAAPAAPAVPPPSSTPAERPGNDATPPAPYEDGGEQGDGDKPENEKAKKDDDGKGKSKGSHGNRDGQNGQDD